MDIKGFFNKLKTKNENATGALGVIRDVGRGLSQVRPDAGLGEALAMGAAGGVGGKLRDKFKVGETKPASMPASGVKDPPVANTPPIGIVSDDARRRRRQAMRGISDMTADAL